MHAALVVSVSLKPNVLLNCAVELEYSIIKTGLWTLISLYFGKEGRKRTEECFAELVSWLKHLFIPAAVVCSCLPCLLFPSHFIPAGL